MHNNKIMKYNTKRALSIKAGPAVYNARAVLNADFNMDFAWGDSSAVANLPIVGSRLALNNSNATIINEVNIYPNPSTGKINLTVPHNNICTYSVSNVFGLTVANGEFNTKIELDLSHLPKGVYLLNINNTNTGEVTKKSVILTN